jgi:hypothetical protein
VRKDHALSGTVHGVVRYPSSLNLIFAILLQTTVLWQCWKARELCRRCVQVSDLGLRMAIIMHGGLVSPAENRGGHESSGLCHRVLNGCLV